MLPLEGVRIIELFARGPLQHAGMLLSDLGADILVITRSGEVGLEQDQMMRGRKFEEVDLKSAAGRDRVLALAKDCDVLLEGNRPGVLERLGLGPAELAAVNRSIIVGRMTGWGQGGPLAHKAGHDINYIAETGILWATRTRGSRPTVALNAVGDNGGGSLYLVNGVLAALLRRARSNEGCVIDAAIVDGASSLLETVRSLRAKGMWGDEPANNLFDSGAPYYDTYECADGEYVAVGAIEPKFYRDFVFGLGFTDEDLPDRGDSANWDRLRQLFAARIRSRNREEWVEVFEPLDACVSPVLSVIEAQDSEHLNARASIRRTASEGFTTSKAPRLAPLPQ